MLNQADVDRAKRELRVRRADTLKRHADELAKLDAQQTEIETLEKLVQSFSEKFGSGPAEEKTPEPVLAEKDPTLAAVVPDMSPTSPAFSLPQRKYQATNFELFSRAFSTGTF